MVAYADGPVHSSQPSPGRRGEDRTQQTDGHQCRPHARPVDHQAVLGSLAASLLVGTRRLGALYAVGVALWGHTGHADRRLPPTGRGVAPVRLTVLTVAVAIELLGTGEPPPRWRRGGCRRPQRPSGEGLRHGEAHDEAKVAVPADDSKAFDGRPHQVGLVRG